MEQYLAASDIINYTHPSVAAKARELAAGCDSETQIARKCFEFVRDEISHTGDSRKGITTCSASEVLEDGTGMVLCQKSSIGGIITCERHPDGIVLSAP